MAKIRVRVNYSEIENKKEVTDNIFRGLKPKSKLANEHFSLSFNGLAICHLRFRGFLKYF